MMLVRFMHDGKEYFGIQERYTVKQLEGDFAEDFRLAGKSFALSDIRLLAPCIPRKVVAVGLNYRDHINEFGDRDIPKAPVLFIKLPHTVIGPDENIIIPEGATRVDYEAELAIVIKKECFRVAQSEVPDYILGATCLNDVTERHVQKEDGQWTRAKNYPTFCPVGPCIVDGLDYNNLAIEMRLNGEIKQKSSTSNLIWNVEQLISFISQVIPLHPGDIVTTGTPCGVGPLKTGDITEVIVEGIGTLRNGVC
jgi:2-keto-4-pentenoate hydratase/2-oxohepta-3-ene-1,7-dioic acid hydratase in catechol pathway